MMENKISSKNTMLNYGLVLGLASIFINLIAYAIGIHLDQDWRVGTLGFVAMIIVIVLGIKNFKAINSNLITWGQSVKIGVGISIISALIGIIYNLIFINFIEPDFMTLLMEKQVVAWEELNMTEEQIGGEYPNGVNQIGRWHDIPNGNGWVVVEADDQEALTSWMMGWASMATFPIVRPVVDDTMSRKAIKSMLASQQE